MRVPINPPPAQKPACLAVIVPAYNEAGTIGAILQTVLAQPLVQEVIVVDDGSDDGTWGVLQPLAQADGRIRLFQHAANQGKGAALRTGLARATAPILIVQDAD
ncbi:MAG TPA: glycosyltransferase family 2 protein, partial [Candidatus Acidoferrum sp.]|nr:glycosyltransferase family 2 protein [Candidatus Acidoferrum sp.]